MPSREEEFKQRFAGALADLATSGSDEQRLMIGSLASRLTSASRAPTWTAFKHGLSFQNYQTLLTSFQRQGPELARLGKHEEIAAIELIAVSLVAKTQAADPEIASGTVVLDQYIDEALALYKDAQAADPIIS